MNIELDNLTDTIESLRLKLDGVGIEIYHLNNTISSLVTAVRNLVNAIEDKE